MISARATIGYSLSLPGLAIGAFFAWQLWSEATRPVMDSWTETGTIVDFEKSEYTSKYFFRKRRLRNQSEYSVDVRTSDGEIVQISMSNPAPRVGKRIKVQWLEYEDGSVAARLAKPKKSKDPYSLNNI